MVLTKVARQVLASQVFDLFGLIDKSITWPASKSIARAGDSNP